MSFEELLELLNIIKHTQQSWTNEVQQTKGEEKQYVQKQKEHTFHNLKISEEPEDENDEDDRFYPQQYSQQREPFQQQFGGEDQMQQDAGMSAMQIYQQSLSLRSRVSSNPFLKQRQASGYHQSQTSTKQSQSSQNIKNHNQISLNDNQSPNQSETNSYSRETYSSQHNDSLAAMRETSNRSEEFEKDSLEYVSPYTIRNELGYAIQIQSDSFGQYNQPVIPIIGKLQNKNPTYTIPTWAEMNYQIDSDSQSAFFRDRNRKEKRTITLTLKHPHLEFEPISGIDLDSVQKTKHLLQSKQGTNGMKIQVIVEVLPQTTRKIIIFRSSLTFINKLDETLEIQLKDPQVMDKESLLSPDSKIYELCSGGEQDGSNIFLVGPNQRLCIPFDKIGYIFTFRFSKTLCFSIKQIDNKDFQNTSKWSKKIDLRKIERIEQDIESYPIKHSEDKISMIKFIKRSQGECIIQAEPSIIIKNCLPVQIKYKLFIEASSTEIKSSNGILQIQQEIQSHYVSLEHRVLIQIQIPGFEWSKKALLLSPEPNEMQVEKIEMFDYQQYSQPIDISKQENTFGSKKYFIYTPQFVINETPYDIFFFTMNKNKLSITSGQRVQSSPQEYFQEEGQQEDQYEPTQKISLFSNYQNILISLDEKGSYLSEVLDLATFGKKTFDLKVPTQQSYSLYQFTMNMSLICADSMKQIYIKCITISPRYILVNKTRFNMEVCQTGQEQNSTLVECENRLPFFWSDGNMNRSLRVRIEEYEQGLWGWGGSIEVEDSVQANMVSFCLRSNRNPRLVKFMKLDIREDDQLVYLVVHECVAADEAVYFLENKLQDIDVCVRQKDYEQQFVVEAEKESQFGWEQPLATKFIIVQMIFKGQYEGFNLEEITLDLEDHDSEREYEIPSYNNPEIVAKVFIMICLEGSTKKIKFYSESDVHERKRLQDNLEIQVGANIRNFSIGIISWNKLKRQEIALCSLKNIEFVMLQTQSERTCQLKLGFIQIDNNLSVSAVYPVVFTPSTFEKMQKLNRPHFSLILVQNIMVKNIKIIKSVKCQLQATTVKLTDTFLDSVIHFVQECTQPVLINQKVQASSEIAEAPQIPMNKNIKQVINNNRQSTSQSLFGDNNVYANGIAREQQKHNISPSDKQNISKLSSTTTYYQFEWQYSKLPNVSGITYINEIEIYPIDLDLSFKANSREGTASESFFVLNIFKAIGLAFKNVDNASVRLKRTKLQNMLDTASGAISRITKNYYLAVISIFLNLIGSLNLFANPLGFAKSIYIGFTDLLSYPIEGFIKGPIEGSLSIFKGIGSLAKNTISGSLNSLQSLTEPLSLVCSTLALDDIYIEKRAQIYSYHPKNAIEGLGIGTWAFLNGVHRGLSGLVDMPYSEAKKKGFVGMLKGTMKGVSGVFFKPICGGFDFVAKTAEGIKNTVTYFDDKPSNQRIRMIRPFYGVDQYYLEFNEMDAQVVQLLNDYIKGKYKDAVFIGVFSIRENEQQEKLLIITLKHIIMIQKKDNKFLWAVETKNIIEIQTINSTIKIIQKLPNKLQILEINELKKETKEIILDKINFVKENVQIQRFQD